VADLHIEVGKLMVAIPAGARPDIVMQNGNYAKSNICANRSGGLCAGLIGGISLQNRTNGLTYGVQAKTWW